MFNSFCAFCVLLRLPLNQGIECWAVHLGMVWVEDGGLESWERDAVQQEGVKWTETEIYFLEIRELFPSVFNTQSLQTRTFCLKCLKAFNVRILFVTTDDYMNTALSSAIAQFIYYREMVSFQFACCYTKKKNTIGGKWQFACPIRRPLLKSLTFC